MVKTYKVWKIMVVFSKDLTLFDSFNFIQGASKQLYVRWFKNIYWRVQ